MFKKFGHITYPEWIDQIAEIIGNERRKRNDKLYEDNPSKKRGDLDSSVHPLGVKGEIIAAMFLFTQGIPHKLNELLSDNPIVDYDIIIANKRVDVKTIRPDGKNLFVTAKSHNNPNKKIDSYFFIQLIDNTNVRYWVYKHDEISNWNIKKTIYNYNYSKPIKDILNVIH